jgi:hypothetical protein
MEGCNRMTDPLIDSLKKKATTRSQEPQSFDRDFASSVTNVYGDYGSYLGAGYDTATKSLPVPQQEWDYRTAESGMNGESLPFGAESWDAFGRPYYGEGLKGWWNGVKSRMTSPTQLSTDFEASSEDEKFMEWGSRMLHNLGELGNLSDVAGADSPLTYVLRASKEVVGGVLDVLSLPGIFSERIIGTIALSDDTETLDEAWQASRIYYSTTTNKALTAQFLEKYKRGENPELLAMEMANPANEFVGQLILDPLNLISWWAKGGKAADMLGDGARMSDDVARVFDKFSDLDDAADSARYAEAQADLFSTIRGAFSKLGGARLKQEYGLRSVAATGRQAGFFNRLSDSARFVSSSIKQLNGNASNVAEIFHELSRAASPIEEIANAGISALLKHEVGSTLLSPQGMEFGVYLNKVVGEGADAERFISTLKSFGDDLPGMVEFLGSKGSRVAGELFPTIQDMKKASALVAKGEDVTARTEQIASMLDKIPKAVRWIDGVDSKLGIVFKPVNNFFGQVYMGYSPGFAARNIINNTFTLIVDQGVRSFVSSEGRIFTKLESVLADTERIFGFVPSASTRSIGLLEDVTGAETTFGGLKKLLPRNVASSSEAFTGALYVNRAGGQALKQQLPHALQPLHDALISKGVDRALADLIVQVGVDEYGDIARTVEKLRATGQAGYISAGRDLTKMPYDLRKYLSNTGKYDEFVDIMFDPSVENFDDIAKKLDSFANSHVASGDKAFEDMVGAVDKESMYTEMVSHMRQAAESKYGISDNQSVMFASWRASHDEAAGSFRSIMNELMSAAPPEIGASTTWKKMAASLSDGTSSLVGEYDQKWRTFFRHAKSGDTGSMRAFGRNIGADIKDDMFDDDVRDAVAQFIRKSKNDAWVEHDKRFYDTVEGFFSEIHPQISPDLEISGNKVGDVLSKGLEEARAKRVWSEKMRYATFDGKRIVYDRLEAYRGAIESGGKGKVVAMFEAFGIPTAATDGVPRNKLILRTLNKYGDAEYDNIADAADDVIDILIKRAAEKGDDVSDLSIALSEGAEDLLPALVGTPTYARAIYESKRGFLESIDKYKTFMKDNWDRQIPAMSDDVEKVLANAPSLVGSRVATAKQSAADVGSAWRDFGLLDYSQKEFKDLALAYMYPYSFWYTGSYKNWMTRTVQNPKVMAGYSKYREFLERKHAGMPEWWKYNISSNEVFGLDHESPLYFNLEATIWPLNGLTGVDFNDPYKRVSGMTALLDDMNKLGPSTWTPYSIAAAVGLSMQGEEEAASRWAGRLIPQTAFLKSVLSLTNVNLPETPFTEGNELDPMVQMFSGGLDPYERRRVGRALSQMITDGTVTEEEAIDAANLQDGELWDQAVMLATKKRAPGQISSFMAGVGFKGRSESDIEIDQFYGDYYSFMSQYDMLQPDEVRNGFDAMRQKYPFMDTLLISRKAGLDRDRSYAYNVLGRIPPGQSGQIAELAGIPGELLSRFYDDKGKIDRWPEGDRVRFMNAVTDISAVLAIPDEATQADWTRARNANGLLRDRSIRIFGDDILDLVDIYYNIPTETQVQRNERDEWLKRNVRVGAYLDWKTQAVITDPTLNAYYGGLSNVESSLRRQMNNEIEQKLGADIFATIDEYYLIRAISSKEGSVFKKAHPEIEQYYDIKDDWQERENQAMARVQNMIRQAPEIQLRDPQTGETVGQSDVRFGLMQEEPRINWQQVLPPEVYGMVEEYWLTGEEIPYYTEQFLGYAAGDYGAGSAEDVIQQIGATIVR